MGRISLPEPIPECRVPLLSGRNRLITNQKSTLLRQIQAYCREANIAESTFGFLAVNDGKLCNRLRSGKDVTLATAQKIEAFIQDHESEFPGDPVPGGPCYDSQVLSDDIPRSNGVAPVDSGRPFRFYDNRQKYLAFINTCNEKWKIAERAAAELAHVQPRPPAFRLFDAGVGDGTLLSHLMRAMHRRFPTLPFFVVGKEISLEDVRLCLEKLPDRFVEHPASVIVLTNLYYSEAPWLMPRDVTKAAALNWQEVELEGASAYEYGEQLRALDDLLVDGWQTKASEKTGNPIYVRPSVLVLYRADNRFLLDSVIPRRGHVTGDYDLLLASQPWRNRMSLDFKVGKILAPLTRSLGPGGRLLAVQSYGQDPCVDLINEIWPEEQIVGQSRHQLIASLKEELGREARAFNFNAGSDARSVFSYQMHTLPEEISSSIGTSTLFAAWNAAIYAAQIEDERLESVISTGEYLDITSRMLQQHNGLWFNDESFVVSRRRS